VVFLVLAEYQAFQEQLGLAVYRELVEYLALREIQEILGPAV
jgi:hypothetical protein